MCRTLAIVGLLLLVTGCAEKPFNNRELIDLLKQQPQLDVRETERGVVVTLPTVVFFAFDSADLTLDARRILDNIGVVLTNPRAATRTLAVEGHSDAKGSDEYNLELSRRRADTVAQELMANRVRQARIHIEGFGERVPIAPNTNPDGSDNPEGRERNRRVEIVIFN
jgi:outer membrane protein OmpA-like peptidoglycan-associated protein